MEKAERTAAIEAGSQAQAQEALRRERQHMLEEQQQLVRAADREKEFERIQWFT